MPPSEIAYRLSLQSRLKVLYYGELLDFMKSSDSGLRGFALGFIILSAVIPDADARIAFALLAGGLLVIHTMIWSRDRYIAATKLVQEYTTHHHVFDDLRLKDEILEDEMKAATTAFYATERTDAFEGLGTDVGIIVRVESRLRRELGLPNSNVSTFVGCGPDK